MLRECSPPTTCHTYCVICPVSHVMCHMPCVTCHINNRPGVAGAVLQTPLKLFIWIINWAIHHFPPDLQITFPPKPKELGSWHFERLFTPTMCHMYVTYHVPCVLCYVSHVTRHISHVMCPVSHLVINRAYPLYFFLLQRIDPYADSF